MQWPVPFISRVRLRNYKSIAQCDVVLGPLTVLVGPNGAGKSNFLDALRFVMEAVATSPDQAITRRGGLGEVLHRTRGTAAESFSVDLDITVPWGSEPEPWASGRYGFTVGSAVRPGKRPFLIAQEHCELSWKSRRDWFGVTQGAVLDPTSSVPESEIDQERLYLPIASGRPNLAPLHGALRGMYFYDPDPHTLRDIQPEKAGATLGPAGQNLGDVLGTFSPTAKERFDDYMRAVVPELVSVDRRFEGRYVTVELRTSSDIAFGPNAMSDGTVRAAGLLAALFQPSARDGRIRLIGVEEPELAVHPAAAGALFDALTEASERVQIIVNTQSPDLLDREDLDPSVVRVAGIKDGATVIGDIDAPSQEIIGKKLATVGQLLRSNQLSPGVGA